MSPSLSKEKQSCHVILGLSDSSGFPLRTRLCTRSTPVLQSPPSSPLSRNELVFTFSVSFPKFRKYQLGLDKARQSADQKSLLTDDGLKGSLFSLRHRSIDTCPAKQRGRLVFKISASDTRKSPRRKRNTHKFVCLRVNDILRFSDLRVNLVLCKCFLRVNKFT